MSSTSCPSLPAPPSAPVLGEVNGVVFRFNAYLAARTLRSEIPAEPSLAGIDDGPRALWRAKF